MTRTVKGAKTGEATGNPAARPSSLPCGPAAGAAKPPVPPGAAPASRPLQQPAHSRTAQQGGRGPRAVEAAQLPGRPGHPPLRAREEPLLTQSSAADRFPDDPFDMAGWGQPFPHEPPAAQDRAAAEGRVASAPLRPAALPPAARTPPHHQQRHPPLPAGPPPLPPPPFSGGVLPGMMAPVPLVPGHFPPYPPHVIVPPGVLLPPYPPEFAPYPMALPGQPGMVPVPTFDYLPGQPHLPAWGHGPPPPPPPPLPPPPPPPPPPPAPTQRASATQGCAPSTNGGGGSSTNSSKSPAKAAGARASRTPSPQPSSPLKPPLPSAATPARPATAAMSAAAVPPEQSPERLQHSARQAKERLSALFPRLPAPLPLWLLWQLLLGEAEAQRERQELLLPPAAAGQALAAMHSQGSGEVATRCEALLSTLRRGFLAGRPLPKGITQVFLAVPGRGSLPLGDCILLTELQAAALQLAASKDASAPVLPPEEEAARRRPAGPALPPPPPPPPAAALAPVPPVLQPFAKDTPALRALVTLAMARLEATSSLAHTAGGTPGGGSSSSSGGSGGDQRPDLGVVVGPSPDFGVQQVAPASGNALQAVAAAVAAQWGGAQGGAGANAAIGGRATDGANRHRELAAADAPSLLDLLQLLPQEEGEETAGQAGTSGGRIVAATAEAAKRPGQGPAAAAAAAAAAALLRFRTLPIHNASSGGSELWVLGGVAVPQLPHTFAVLDDARTFLGEGHQAVQLLPGATHHLTIALSTADGSYRSEECGLLKQLLLLVLAVPARSPAAAQLEALQGALAVADAGSEPQGAASGPAFRVFVVGRQATVALVRRARELRSLLDVEAKPFVAESLRRVFDSLPHEFLREHTGHSVLALQTPCCALEQMGRAAAEWAATGAAVLPPIPLPVPLNGSGASKEAQPAREGGELEAAQKFRRLLVLEELAMEEGIRRFDMWNVRLRVAVFRQGRHKEGPAFKFSLWETTPAGTLKPTGRTGIYRGAAAPSWLQPEGVATTEGGTTLRLLAVVEVPGLAEGRPTLVAGDTVYLRTAQRPEREVAAAFVGAEGSSAFLLLPPAFWGQQDVAPLVAGLARELSKGEKGAGEAAEEEEAAGAGGSAGAFNGLVHVRFSFDRGPLALMRAALAAIADPSAASSPCPCRLLPPEDPSDASPLQPAAQPSLEWLAAEVGSLAERGRQRLNAEQRAAVAAVVGGGGRAVPYALFGPPGTGKTVTLVECALQLLAAYPSSARLLLCAPQNYSADLLCSALAASGVPPTAMCRLNDPRRPAPQVKEDVLPFCWHDSELNLFRVPGPAMLQHYSVVVCTCTAAGLLLAQGQAFTHVLIDEAGQALLPEALIPLTLLQPPAPPPAAAAAAASGGPGSAERGGADKGEGALGPGQRGWGAVLCGDPQQLGPVVHSPLAAGAGLSTSLLERWIAFHGATAHLYGSQAPPTVQLVRNYRSHARLLDLPSRLFYKSSLLAAADPASVLAPAWQELSGAPSDSDSRAPSPNTPPSPAEDPPVAQHAQRAEQAAAAAQQRAQRAQQQPAHAEQARAQAGAAQGGGSSLWQGGQQAAQESPSGSQPGARVSPSFSQGSANCSKAAGGGPTGSSGGGSPDAGMAAATVVAAAAEAEGDGNGDGEGEGEGSWPEEAGWEEGEAEEGEDEDSSGGDRDGPMPPSLANLLFYGVMGQQMREGEAPSYFNPMEASVVAELVQGLLGCGAGVVPDHIGVMATYRKQVQKVRLLLRERGLGAIRVGTVDDYQGQEERIIFITTVLSRPESLPPPLPGHGPTPGYNNSNSDAGSGSGAGADSVGSGAGGSDGGAAGAASIGGGSSGGDPVNLGFWRNPKRFNVAITRAKALLVVVGHPLVLLQDANWRELLSYCVSRGVYRGAGASVLWERLGVATGGEDEDEEEEEGGNGPATAGEEAADASGGVGGQRRQLHSFIQEMAEKALLGSGDASLLYPSTLDEMYAAYSDETPGRVML